MIRKRLLLGILSLALIGGVLLFSACSLLGGEDDNTDATYTVSYDFGDGSGTVPASQTVTSGTSINLPGQGNMIAPSEKAFTGWRAGGRSYKVGDSYTVTGNVTFIAQWGDAGDNNGDDNTGKDADGISWANEGSGTLTVTNNTSKDMVIFQGQTPSASNIMGGIRGLSTRAFDVSDDVNDFNVGGFLILRGIALDEYNANKTNLSRAKIEYSAMATYGQGKKYRAEISPNYMGDYGYRVTNLGRIGMELRKDSPDGEKIGYLPSLASNMLLYADTTDGFAIYPVFVYYNKSNGQVTTLKPSSQFETVSVSPRPASGSEIQAYTFPADQGATWDSIKASLSSPVAYVTITNSVANQSGRVTLSGTNRLYSQNGYDSIGSGEILTYEIKSTQDGSPQAVIVTYYNQALQVPILDNDGKTPTLKNGYDYTISISGSGQTADGYSVTFKESATARDLSSDIESL
jgi:hypothetical protein